MFTESEQTVRHEPNLAAGFRGDQANVTEVVANCAGDGNATHGLHLGKRIHQALILALLKGIDEDSSILVRGAIVDGHLHADYSAHLSASSHGSRVDNLPTPVICRKIESGRRQQSDYEKGTAVAEFAKSGFSRVALCHCFSPVCSTPTQERNSNGSSRKWST